MLRITVTKDGGLPQVSTFDKREITIGRTNANDLVIAEPGVSSSHARLLSTGDGITLIDLESTNGTFVNGERIRGPALIQPGDEVYICAYRLDFDPAGAAGAAEGPPPMVGTPPPPVDGPPPMVGGSPPPEYPTAAESGPPPMVGTPPPLDGPPMLGGGAPPEPEALDGAPPMLEPPPPVGGPAAVTPIAPPTPIIDEPPPLAPPSVASPPPSVEPPPAVTPPPVVASPPPPVGEPPPPVAPPEPVAAPTPEPATPPPMAPVAPAPPAMDEPEPPAASPPASIPEPLPLPVDADDSRPASVSGSFSAPDETPDVTPRSVALASDLPVATPGRPERMATIEQPVSPYAGARRPAGFPPAAAPMPPAGVPGAVVMPVSTAPMPLAPPNADLSDLKGSGVGAQACARVFALVQYDLAPDGRLPERDAQTRARARSEAARLLSSVAERVPEVQARPWANRIANELCGLGALSAPLAEPDVLEVQVNGPEHVHVRRRDSASPAPIDATFSCPAAVELVVRRLTDRPFGPNDPVIDARTPDGADIRAVHSSVTSPGPLVTIHRRAVQPAARGLETLVQQRALPSGMATMLHHCVQAGLNILVCGGPGTHTFPWLAALVAEIPTDERVVVVRPSIEPDPLPSHAVVIHSGSLRPREGLSGPQWAMRGALGLGPDRLVVHEVAGPEASDVVATMSRGPSGTIASVRASSADAGLVQLTTLAGLTGDAPDAAARTRYVAQSLEVVLAVSRFADGHTRVTQLAEATVSSAGTAQAIEVVNYDPNTGQWAPTGIAPTFIALMQRRGIDVDVGLLSE
ncbi:MAG: ATPase, T2SS/T4P/T4SS family [Myxococcota bacterium]